MLALRELKRIVDEPARGDRVPSVKYLKGMEIPVISKCMGDEAQITAYPNGYALYQVYGHTTVFPIRTCGDYLYVSGGNGICIPESFFNQEPWYIRLILEGGGPDRQEPGGKRAVQDSFVQFHIRRMGSHWGSKRIRFRAFNQAGDYGRDTPEPDTQAAHGPAGVFSTGENTGADIKRNEPQQNDRIFYYFPGKAQNAGNICGGRTMPQEWWKQGE